MVPLSDQHREFADRFGVSVMTSFNMTETFAAVRDGIRRFGEPVAARALAWSCASSMKTTAKRRTAKLVN